MSGSPDAGWSSLVARRAHNPKVAGSNPAPATKSPWPACCWPGPRAKAGQKVPQGYYNLEMMLGSVARRGGEIGVCGTCMDARGIGDVELADGCHRSTLDELTDWTQTADRVLVF